MHNYLFEQEGKTFWAHIQNFKKIGDRENGSVSSKLQI